MRSTVHRTVAVALACGLGLTGVAFASQTTVYGGTTGQAQGGVHFRISFNVSRHVVSDIQLAATVNKGPAICRIASSVSLRLQNGKLKVKRAKFSGKLKDGKGDTLTITGKFKGRTVSGTFVVASTGGVQGTTTCSSGTVKFKARSGGGQSHHTKYSGTVGPGFPISFRVSSNGKDVHNLAVAFNETCTPGAGSVAPVFHFGTLAIKSGTFSGTLNSGAGSTVSQTLHITGTFFGRTASGQVSDTVRITSLPSCTETLSFTAKAK